MIQYTKHELTERGRSSLERHGMDVSMYPTKKAEERTEATTKEAAKVSFPCPMHGDVRCDC
jgi:hypothetical protein